MWDWGNWSGAGPILGRLSSARDGPSRLRGRTLPRRRGPGPRPETHRRGRDPQVGGSSPPPAPPPSPDFSERRALQRKWRRPLAPHWPPSHWIAGDSDGPPLGRERLAIGLEARGGVGVNWPSSPPRYKRQGAVEGSGHWCGAIVSAGTGGLPFAPRGSLGRGGYGVLGLNPAPYVYSPRAWGGGRQQGVSPLDAERCWAGGRWCCCPYSRAKPRMGWGGLGKVWWWFGAGMGKVMSCGGASASQVFGGFFGCLSLLAWGGRAALVCGDDFLAVSCMWWLMWLVVA